MISRGNEHRVFMSNHDVDRWDVNYVMPEIIESISPSGKHKVIYPVESKAQTVAISFHPGEAASLAAALITASGKCKRGHAVHLTAYRETGRWTVNVVKSKR